MNYAEDRLDRRARNASVWTDLQQAAAKHDHEWLARSLRDVGWNREALFHYGLAWCNHYDLSSSPDKDNSCWQAAADYAQMADLAGFPAVGICAMLIYRTGGALLEMPPAVAVNVATHQYDAARSSSTSDDEIQPSSIILQDDNDASPPVLDSCPCGISDCGRSICFIPWEALAEIYIMDALREYTKGRMQYLYKRQRGEDGDEVEGSTVAVVPTAHQLLQELADKNNVDLSEIVEPQIPKLLQFWTCATVEFRSIPAVLQLLMIKLLYSVLPSLAAEACVYIQQQESSSLLAETYKSHWAYFVFIRALVLGIRIKPHRIPLLKHYRSPLWDQLWGVMAVGGTMTSRMRDDCNSATAQSHGSGRYCPVDDDDSAEFVQSLVQLLNSLRSRDQADRYPPLLWMAPIVPLTTDNAIKSIYFVGDSHVLSLAWQSIQIQSQSFRLVVPIVVTGLKAWHAQSSTKFFTHTCLQTVLRRLPQLTQTVVLSAGEIDCREGMGGPLLQGYTQACHHHVQNTARTYIRALSEIMDQHENLSQILILPVAPHLLRSKGRVVGQASRRETMRVWNKELRLLLPEKGIFLLDYTESLQAVGCDAYALNPIFNADSTHMNAAFAPLLEKAVRECGCDLNLL